MSKCDKSVEYEFVGPLPCDLGAGHLGECRAASSAATVARLVRLSRYEAALTRIAAFGGDCGEIAADALGHEE